MSCCLKLAMRLLSAFVNMNNKLDLQLDNVSLCTCRLQFLSLARGIHASDCLVSVTGRRSYVSVYSFRPQGCVEALGACMSTAVDMTRFVQLCAFAISRVFLRQRDAPCSDHAVLALSLQHAAQSLVVYKP